jgi:outer membrane protein insertion porin family
VTLFESRELESLLQTKAGMVFNSKTIAIDRRKIEGLYLQNGYNLIRVTADLDTSGCLTIRVDEGMINGIRVEGAERTRRWAIMRHIPFDTGDVYVRQRGERAVDDLYGTGLFESAMMIAEPDSSGITLLIKVVEKPYNLIRGGARFDLEYKSKAFVDLVADNLIGGGQEVFISATLGEKRRSLSFHYQADRLFKTLFTNALMLDYSELKRNHYIDHRYHRYFKQRSFGGELTPGRQIPQFGIIYIVGLMRHIEWYEPDRGGKQEFNKYALGGRSLVDTRDAISFPESGKYHLFDLEFASDLRDRKTAYTRFFTSIEAYYQITKRLNFHPRLAMGASSNAMPYFDRFALGGLRSFLGLHEDEFLGDKTTQGALELRNKIGDRFYVMARYNIAGIWNKIDSVRLAKLRHGGGIGIGLKTPFGPIQSWYGRTDSGLDAIYLEIGHEW